MVKKKIAVFISGNGSNLKSLVKYSKKKKCSFKIELVISNNPDAIGLIYAKKIKLRNFFVEFRNKQIFENNSLKLLKRFNIEIICLAGFMKILSGNFIKKFSNPILNIHPSLLPKYKGLNTHLKAIKNNEKFSGATIHKVNKKLDSGKIILQKKVKILKRDNVRSLQKKILKIEHEIYPKALVKFISSL